MSNNLHLLNQWANQFCDLIHQRSRNTFFFFYIVFGKIITVYLFIPYSSVPVLIEIKQYKRSIYLFDACLTNSNNYILIPLSHTYLRCLRETVGTRYIRRVNLQNDVVKHLLSSVFPMEKIFYSVSVKQNQCTYKPLSSTVIIFTIRLLHVC